MLGRMNAGQGVDVRDHWRQPVSPFSCSFVIGNQVLSYLDQDMGEALCRRVAIHGIVLEGTVIRFVVANRQIDVFTQQRQSGFTARSSLSQRRPICRGGPFPSSAA